MAYLFSYAVTDNVPENLSSYAITIWYSIRH